MSKRAMELSLNFLVIMIISLVVFFGSLALLTKIMSKSEEYRKQIDSSTQQEIENLLESGQRVAIPFPKKDAKPGDQVVFGLGIFNVLRNGDLFNVSVRIDAAYYENNNSFFLNCKNNPGSSSCKYINSHWTLMSNVSTYRVRINEKRSIPILINVNPNYDTNTNTPRHSIFIFNVNVTSPNGKLYDGKLHKLYIRII